jgi:hypothetical protein
LPLLFQFDSQMLWCIGLYTQDPGLFGHWQGCESFAVRRNADEGSFFGHEDEFSRPKRIVVEAPGTRGFQLEPEVAGVGWTLHHLQTDAFSTDRWPMQSARFPPFLGILVFWPNLVKFRRLAARIDLTVSDSYREILVGGTGEKRTPRLAGTFGGEFSIAETPPEGVAVRIERARAAAAAAGRDPDALLISMTSAISSGATQAEITTNLDRFGAATGHSGQEAREMWEERGLTFRTWEEHRDRLGQYAAAGVDRVYIQLATRVADHAAECLEQFMGI